MRNQLEQMQESNGLTKQTLIVSQGPQVYVMQMKLLNLRAKEKARVEIEVKNSGHIGADEFSIGTFIDVRQGVPLNSIDLGEPSSGSGLAPDLPTHVQVESQNIFSPDQVNDVTKGIQNLYIYGVIKYRSPLERGVFIYLVFCSKYDSTRSDRLFIGCPFAPELTINGKPLVRTHEPQKHP